MTVKLTPELQTSLLDVIEYALASAEADLDSNAYEYEAGRVSYDPADFDPEALAVWLNDAPELARLIDAMPEIIENAEILKQRLNALEARS